MLVRGVWPSDMHDVRCSSTLLTVVPMLFGADCCLQSDVGNLRRLDSPSTSPWPRRSCCTPPRKAVGRSSPASRPPAFGQSSMPGTSGPRAGATASLWHDDEGWADGCERWPLCTHISKQRPPPRDLTTDYACIIKHQREVRLAGEIAPMAIRHRSTLEGQGWRAMAPGWAKLQNRDRVFRALCIHILCNSNAAALKRSS